MTEGNDEPEVVLATIVLIVSVAAAIWWFGYLADVWRFVFVV